MANLLVGTNLDTPFDRIWFTVTDVPEVSLAGNRAQLVALRADSRIDLLSTLDRAINEIFEDVRCILWALVRAKTVLLRPALEVSPAVESAAVVSVIVCIGVVVKIFDLLNRLVDQVGNIVENSGLSELLRCTDECNYFESLHSLFELVVSICKCFY